MTIVQKKSNSHGGGPMPRHGAWAADGFGVYDGGIALCLGVIAFALVAIIGVLPTGIRVQKDNREDTIINQEGLLLVEAIRSGSRGLDYLTNYFDTITVSISWASPIFSTLPD